MKRTVRAIEGRERKRAPKKKDPALISTGSTLLDLAISGGVYEAGGIPAGNLVEIFGPSGTGKTVLLCEIAGNVQKKKGQAFFMDPEGRLNNEFAKLFGFTVDDCDYSRPDTVPEVFKPIRSWEPEPEGPIHGIFADSLAALSTSMEMTGEDKMGMRRAKEFSEELRKTCRVLASKDFLMVCSNQVRTKVGASMFEEKSKTPGGEAIPFYASLRLQTSLVKKLKTTKKIHKKEHTKFYGILTNVKVYKNSLWAPYNTAPVYIIFDYGVDDIRANIMYLKDIRGTSKYEFEDSSWGNINNAIAWIEENEKEAALKKEVIAEWRGVQAAFKNERIPKRR